MGFSDVMENIMTALSPVPIIGGIASGIGSLIQNKKANDIASQTQQFNEQYSMQQLAQMEKQFQLNNATANRNIDFQKEIAEKNLAFQMDAFNRQLAENELTRQREDTAYQRQIEDLTKAGFSPLMASNGAGAQSMNVGSAPQYDVSGVSTAQSSALGLAQEYANLKNMAQNQYLTRKQQATNQSIGAKLALQDLLENRRINNMDLSLKAINIANELKDAKKRRELIDEQIQESKDKRNWMNKYGYRDPNLLQQLLPIFKKIGDKLNINTDTIAEKIAGSFNLLNTTIQKILDKDYINRDELPTTTKELVGKLTNAELSELASIVSLGAFGMKFSEEDLGKLADYYFPKLPERSSYLSKEAFNNWLKRDGVNALMMAFGLSYQ